MGNQLNFRSMEKENLFVLDIDDTLTKSEYQHVSAYVEAMKTFGIHHINKDWKSYKHVTDSFIIKRNYEETLHKEFSLNLIPEFEDEMMKSLEQNSVTKPIKGAVQALEFIENKTNYAVCFATGSLKQPALLKLQRAGFKVDERLIATSNSIYDREGIVLDAIESAKRFYDTNSFKNIISVGDGLWDVTTARNLNLHFIGIGEKNKADFDAEQIKSYIKDWTAFDLETIGEELGIIDM